MLLSAQGKSEALASVLENISSEVHVKKLLPIIKKEPNVCIFVPCEKPVTGIYRISSTFGYRKDPFTETNGFHSGIDMAAQYAEVVKATANGEVIFTGKKGGYGKCVIIQHKFGFETVYAHLTAYYTKKHKIVKRGEVIGFIGSTGRSTGNHLHYEIRKNGKPINPLIFFD